MKDETHHTAIADMHRALITVSIALVDANHELINASKTLGEIISEECALTHEQAFHVAKSCAGRRELLRNTNTAVDSALLLAELIDVRHWLQVGYLVAEQRVFEVLPAFTSEGRERLRTLINQHVVRLFPQRPEVSDSEPFEREQILHDIKVMGFEEVMSDLELLNTVASMSAGQLSLITAHLGCKKLFADESNAMARAVNIRAVEEVLTNQ